MFVRSAFRSTWGAIYSHETFSRDWDGSWSRSITVHRSRGDRAAVRRAIQNILLSWPAYPARNAGSAFAFHPLVRRDGDRIFIRQCGGLDI